MDVCSPGIDHATGTLSMHKLVTTAALLIAAPTLALAHAGALDKNGCHQNKAKNVYECHQGPLKGQTFKSKAEAEAKLQAAQTGSAAKPGQQAAKVPSGGHGGTSAPPAPH